MKKNILFLLLIVVFISSCEKDDFCIDPITPNLIIRFYDADNPTQFKSVSELYVWPDGRDSIIVNSVVDSIAIPLDVTSAQTLYNFSMGTTVDQLTIEYTVNEVFVSRSCGFKAEFSDLLATPTNNWIQSLELSTTIIENESAAHIQIFH